MNVKYRIILNYNNENHIYYKYAQSDLQALLRGIRELERELKRVPGSLTNYFKYKPHSWEVKTLI